MYNECDMGNFCQGGFKMAKKEENYIMRERKRWGFLGIPWTFTVYTLKEKKLVIDTGFFTSTKNEILLYRIVDLSYSRTLGQKICGLGTITVYSKDKTNPNLIIKNIKHSNDFYEAVSDAVEKDRIRMKMRQSELIDIDSGEDIYDDTE